MKTLVWGFLLAALASDLAAQAPSTVLPTPSARDLDPPLQDLETLKGEVVWLQAALLRGDPTPYRDPRIPLAAYEQGILDEEGRMWTILDTPKGRELRYNPDLRGQRVEVRGWLYPESRILNVHAWADFQSHPVRLDEGFPEPERIPFDPSKAQPVETIKPAAPLTIQPDLLSNSLWKIQEGTDLCLPFSTAPIPLPVAEDSGRIQEILEERGLLPPATDMNAPKVDLPNSTAEIEPAAPIPSPSDRPFGPVSPPTRLQSRVLNEAGEPLARPEEFDEALQKSLVE